MKIVVILVIAGLCAPLFSQEPRPDPVEPEARKPGDPFSLSLVVTRGGFTRTAVSLEADTYDIRVVDRTGGKRFQVQLDRISSERVDGEAPPEPGRLASGAAPIGRGEFKTLQTLTPGVYQIKIADSPKWICTITVKRRKLQ